MYLIMKVFQTLFISLLVIISFVARAQDTSFNYKTDYPAYLKRAQDSTNPNYYKKLHARLAKLDTSLSAKALLHLLVYTTASPAYDPVVLDTLCQHLYDANENKNYNKAIVLADSILRLVPLSLTAVQEKALALKKLGRKNEEKKYAAIMRRTIEALLLSGDGYYDHPFLGVNFFDGISFYGAVYQCYPSKSGLMLDKKGRLLAAFYCYSSTQNNIMIQYFQVDHAMKYYKSNITGGQE